jgi:hypothetical protein
MKLLINRYTGMAALALVGVVLLAPAVEARGPFVRFGPGVSYARPVIHYNGGTFFNQPFRTSFSPGFRFTRPFPTTFGNGVPFPVAQNINPPFQPTWLQRSALANWAYNTAVIGRTYAQFPPWLFGYNPYPPAFVGGYWPPYYPGSGYTPWSPGFNPYANGYNPFITPYNINGIPYASPGTLYPTGYNPYAVP